MARNFSAVRSWSTKRVRSVKVAARAVDAAMAVAAEVADAVATAVVAADAAAVVDAIGATAAATVATGKRSFELAHPKLVS
jgi:hypothetical protein